MKHTLRISVLAGLILASGVASAGWSANAGWASDYYFRGILQSPTSPNGGIDYESDTGFYVGTWAADVYDGLEVDLYGGFAGEAGDFSYGIGYTGYFYTGEFDDTYHEINLSAGYGIVTLDVAVGQYDGDFDSVTPGDQDSYTFAALTLAQNGFYGTIAAFSQDAEGSYFQAGYDFTVAELDLGISLLVADEDLSIGNETNETLIFTISKTFDLQ